MKRITSFALTCALIILTATGCTKGKNERVAVQGPTISRIKERGQVLIGTTGDYRPLTFRDPDGSYWGLEIDIARALASSLGVQASFVPTSWPSLTEDTLASPQKFDFAIGGITITEQRKESMDMSEGYLANGKTILCRKGDASRFRSLSDIDQSHVRVMVNPGGLNEKFARAKLKQAQIIVFTQNEEIPSRVAEGKADIMISEITEAPWYIQNDERLAAPLIDQPFTQGQIGILMQKGQDDLLLFINDRMAQMKKDGSLNRLLEKYGL